MTSCYHGSKISGSQQSFLTETSCRTAICIVDRLKKSATFSSRVQSCTGKTYISIFSFFFFAIFAVCLGPEILHPWQRDVKTSPRYTRQSWILDSRLWFPGFRYWIPEFSLSEELVFRIPVVRGIPN